MSPTPLCLSPALPSELLSYILRYHTYPTTLIICSSQSDFISSAIEDIRRKPPPRAAPSTSSQETGHGDDDDDGNNKNNNAEHPPPPPSRTCSEHVKRALISSPLYQVAASRHIRVVYAPTVTHLRAYLSVFSPEDSRVPAPPQRSTSTATSTRRPCLLLYGFLDLHRGTSEWSAQGLSNTASALVELAHRLSWQAVIVEPLVAGGARGGLGMMLRETAPVLSGGAQRTVPGLGEGAWSGRTVEVGRVLRRWFVFERGMWDDDDDDDDGDDNTDSDRHGGERQAQR